MVEGRSSPEWAEELKERLWACLVLKALRVEV